MKNVELWPRDTDRKILVAASTLSVVAFAALVGAWLPTPQAVVHLDGLSSLITAALLVFVWGAFRSVRPVRYTQTWIVAEFVAVPVIWTLLVVALALWFHHLSGVLEEIEYSGYALML